LISTKDKANESEDFKKAKLTKRIRQKASEAHYSDEAKRIKEF